MTQEKLAELCETDTCYIGQIETHRRFPSITLIEKIAAALQVESYVLFLPVLPAEIDKISANEIKTEIEKMKVQIKTELMKMEEKLKELEELKELVEKMQGA